MTTPEIIVASAKMFIEDDFEEYEEIKTINDCFDYYNNEDLLNKCYYYIAHNWKEPDVAMMIYEECIEYLFRLTPKIY